MSVVFAGLPVSSLEEALVFYERLFDREPDMRPNEIEACWQVGEEGWLYVMVDAERAGGGIATVIVEALDDWLPRLPSVELGEAGGMRTAIFLDPDGNRLQVAGP